MALPTALPTENLSVRMAWLEIFVATLCELPTDNIRR